jgi:hypothetical protein
MRMSPWSWGGRPGGSLTRIERSQIVHYADPARLRPDATSRRIQSRQFAISSLMLSFGKRRLGGESRHLFQIGHGSLTCQRPTVDFVSSRKLAPCGRCRRAARGRVQINSASSSSTRRRERGLRLASRRASKAARNPFIRALLSRAGARRPDWSVDTVASACWAN